MLMTAVALPIGGTTHADDPARVLTTAADYGDEFVFERWGRGSAKVTPSTINYGDEFVVTEVGRQSLKLTPRAINYGDEFVVTEAFTGLLERHRIRISMDL